MVCYYFLVGGHLSPTGLLIIVVALILLPALGRILDWIKSDDRFKR